MAKRPGHVEVITEVGYCNFCNRTRNLRREEHHLGGLVRTILSCETCHRTLSSTMGVEPEQTETEAEPEPKPKAEPEPATAEAPAAKAKPKRAAAKKPAAKPKTPPKPRSTATRKTTRSK